TVVACSVLLLTLACRAGDDRKEPVHEGKRLSEWIALLKSADWEQRAAAVDVIAELGAAANAAIPALVEALKEKDEQLQLEGAISEAFRAIGEDSAPALAKLLHDSDQEFVARSVRCLESLGPKAKAAIPDLVALLKKSPSNNSYQIALALGKIGKDAVPALV